MEKKVLPMFFSMATAIDWIIEGYSSLTIGTVFTSNTLSREPFISYKTVQKCIVCVLSPCTKDDIVIYRLCFYLQKIILKRFPFFISKILPCHISSLFSAVIAKILFLQLFRREAPLLPHLLHRPPVNQCSGSNK